MEKVFYTSSENLTIIDLSKSGNQNRTEISAKRLLTSSSYIATKESTNFSRVCRLLLDIGTDVLKEYFDSLVPADKLWEHLISKKEKLKKLPCLREYQRRKLFPDNNTPLSSEFDICLLYALLRETCSINSPRNGWGKIPDKSDISAGAFIERIRQARNEVYGHAKGATLDNSEFNTHWNEISEAIIGLGGSEYIRIINDLKSEPLDVSQHIISAQMERILETRGKDDEYFVETRATKAVEDQLKENGAVLLLGDPGDGKTSSAWHIILKYIQNGYQLVVINDAEQWLQKWNPTTKQVFLVEDCFGQSRAIPEKAESWRKLQNDLHNCIDHSNTFIIATLRRLIYRELRDILQGFTLFGSLIDISEPYLRLTSEERKRIFCKYAGGKVKDYDSSILKTVLDCETPRFPLSCRLFFSNQTFERQGSKYFHNPIHQLREDLTQLFHHDHLLFGALILLLICDNKVLVKDLLKIEDKKQPISLAEWIKVLCCFSYCFPSDEQGLIEKIEHIKLVCNIPKCKNLNHFHDALNTLQDIYVDFLDGSYTFTHQSILETVGVILAKDNITFLLKHSSANFIQQRIRTQGSITDTDICDESMIQISEKHYVLLAQRLTVDVISGAADAVFQNPSVSDEKFCSSWISYIKTLDQTEVRRFIKSIDNKGFSLMYWAARAGHINFFNFCINIEIPSRDAIHGACSSGDIGRVKLLVSKGVDLNKIDATGSTPLMLGCQVKHSIIVKLLVSSGANVNQEQENVGSPLHVACWNQNIDLVKILIENGAQTNIVTSAGWPNIYFSTIGDNKTALTMLLKGNKCISLNSNTNWTPLHLASGKENTDIVRLLLSNGADVNYLTTQQWSPLFCAAAKGQYNMIDILVNHGANVNQTSHFNMTAMHRVCYDGQINIAKLLFRFGANLNSKSNAGYTPLHCACEFGFIELARFLIKNGADVNVVGVDNKKPIDVARKKNKTEIVQWLENLSA